MGNLVMGGLVRFRHENNLLHQCTIAIVVACAGKRVHGEVPSTFGTCSICQTRRQTSAIIQANVHLDPVYGEIESAVRSKQC